MSWKRALLLLLYVPPACIAALFEWLADLAYGPLYRENTRIREARRQKQLRNKAR